MEKQHAFVYSSMPMMASLLGWILQQSDSYKSNYFRYDALAVDPWDNHSDDPDNWSHAFIEDVEDEVLGNDFTWLNEFVDSFKCNTIFGLSYGGWRKNKPWYNNNIFEILILPTNRLFDLFYQVYEKRLVSPNELLENIKMHVHDHKQDNKIYNERMMNEIYPNALEYAKRNELEFWQLQYCFHHGGASIPALSEMNNIKNTIQSEISSTNFVKNNDTVVIEDLFNINLKELCKNLNIIHNEHMELAYNKFLDFVDEKELI